MRPDVILILTDQERAIPHYEGQEVADWRARMLTGRRWFDEHGVSLNRHYTGAVACVPSRPTLFTGHYPDLHGVTQTDGIGKEADERRMRWLRPGEVPTMGHWFRAAGYDTHYDGKWHLSHADLHDSETGERIATNTPEGIPIPEGVRAYLDADPLDAFGFSGWVGPEPHGGDVADCGLRRDPLIAERVTSWLADRYARRLAGDPAALRPFLLVASFVNPHDLVLFPAWVRHADESPVAVDPYATPVPPAAPSATEDLTTKPAVQTRYRDTYPTAYGPVEIVGAMYTDNAEWYRSMYLRLHADVDGPLDAVRQAVTEGATGGGATAGTVLVRTADHGELLGAHGGLHQKWFTLYDEAVRVPMTIVRLDGSGAPVTTAATVEDVPTSHVDLLPTLLDAAGADREEQRALADGLADRFSEVHDLPGRSLWPLVASATGGTVGTSDADRTVYLQTRDNILEGDGGACLAARRLGIDDPPPELRIAVPTSAPCNLEAVVGVVEDAQAEGGGGHLWKLVRTFDDPDCWTVPNERQLATSGPDGATWRHDQLDDEWELYDLTADADELRNLATLPSARPVLDHLRTRLELERSRCVPRRTNSWPYATGRPRYADADTGA